MVKHTLENSPTGIHKDKAHVDGKTETFTKAISNRDTSRDKVCLCAMKGVGTIQENGNVVR